MKTPLFTVFSLFTLPVLLAGVTCSTTKKLEHCDSPDSDCCETNEQCQLHFGAEFPFCADEDCVECTSDEHCVGGLVCLNDDAYGFFCGLAPQD
jgi:hypothetical protein